MAHGTDPSHPAFYLRVIRKWWYLPLIFAVLAMMVSYVASKRMIKKEYGAHVVLQVHAKGAGNDANSYSILMTTGPAMTAAYDALPAKLQKQAKASLYQTTCSPDQLTARFVTCYTTSHNPKRSAVIVNTLANTFVAGLVKNQKSILYPQLKSLQTQEQQQRATIASLQRQIEAKAASLKQVNTQVGTTSSRTSPTDRTQTDLFNKFQIKSLQSQIAQAQNNLNQLTYEESIATGHVLDVVKTQEARLRTMIATLQARLKQKYANVQQQIASQNAASQAKAASQTQATRDRIAAQNAAKAQSLQVHYQLSFLQAQSTEARSALRRITSQEATIQARMQARAPIGVIDPASPNTNPVVPNIPLNLLLGLIIGLAIAIALIIVLEFRDKRFRELEEISQVTALPVLGVVPPFNGPSSEFFLVPVTQPLSSHAEAYRLSRSNIESVIPNRGFILLIESAMAGEGKSVTAANLAASMALAGRTVLLVDGDLRRAGLSRYFGFADVPGLSDILSGTVDIAPIATDVPGLYVVPSGSASSTPAELLDSGRMREWLEEQRDHFDIILLDSPPLTGLADGRILLGQADAGILVMDPDRTPRTTGEHVRDIAQRLHANVLGIVVNRSPWDGNLDYSTRSPYETPVQRPAAAALANQVARVLADHRPTRGVPPTTPDVES